MQVRGLLAFDYHVRKRRDCDLCFISAAYKARRTPFGNVRQTDRETLGVSCIVVYQIGTDGCLFHMVTEIRNQCPRFGIRHAVVDTGIIQQILHKGVAEVVCRVSGVVGSPHINLVCRAVLGTCEIGRHALWIPAR